MFIDSKTAREELLSAIYSDSSLLDHFMNKDMDPEFMDTDEIRNEVMAWVESGDECKGC